MFVYLSFCSNNVKGMKLYLSVCLSVCPSIRVSLRLTCCCRLTILHLLSCPKFLLTIVDVHSKFCGLSARQCRRYLKHPAKAFPNTSISRSNYPESQLASLPAVGIGIQPASKPSIHVSMYLCGLLFMAGCIVKFNIFSVY